MAGRARGVIFCLAACMLACAAPPRIDTASDETTVASLKRVRDSLPEQKRASFDDAVMTVAWSRLGEDAPPPTPGKPPEARLLASLNGMTAEEVLTEARRIAALRQEAQRTGKPVPGSR
jgi:Family of unknown function (DUF6694)